MGLFELFLETFNVKAFFSLAIRLGINFRKSSGCVNVFSVEQSDTSEYKESACNFVFNF